MKSLEKTFKSFFKVEKNWPFLFFLSLVFVFFWKVFLQGLVPLPADFIVGTYYPWLDYNWGFPTGVPVKNPITTDVVSFTYPMQTLSISLMRQGVLPLWNNLILTGSPLLANFQSAPFAITNVFYVFLGNVDGWTARVLSQHFLAAASVYFLLRHWKVSKLGATFAGTLFAFSGFSIIWSQWNAHVLTAAFVPALLMFEDKYLGTGRYKYGAAFSALVALQMFSGYPQVVVYTAFAVVLFALWKMWVGKQRHTVLLRIFGIAVFGLLGLGVASVQILPAGELLSISQRDVELHPYNWAFLPWSKLIIFFAPDFFGNHATANYWGPQDYTSNTNFVGVVGFVAASFAVFRKRSVTTFLLFLLGFSLALAFATPLSVFLWESGPLGLQAASAHRALVLFTLSVSLLSGFGLDALTRAKKTKISGLIFTWIVVGGYFLVTSYLLLSNRADPEIVRGINKYLVGFRNLIFPVLVLALATVLIMFVRKYRIFSYLVALALLGLMTVELFRFGWKFTPFSSWHIIYPDTPTTQFLQEQDGIFRVTGNRVVPINFRMAYDLSAPEGYDAVYPLRISKFLSFLNSDGLSSSALGRYGSVDNDTSPLLDMINTRYYIATNLQQDIDRFDTSRFARVFEDKTTVIYESKTVLPRAFMVYDWEVLSEEEVLVGLFDARVVSGEKVLIETIPKAALASGERVENEVVITSYEANQIELEVGTGQSGLLFVSDAFYPGWKAYVDGAEVEIHRANYSFRSVEVPQGEHNVVFKYAPSSFANGLKLSGLSTVLLTGGFVIYGRRS